MVPATLNFNSTTAKSKAQPPNPEPHGGPSLGWLIDPVPTQSFFDEYWEKRPLIVNRSQSDYFRSLLSFEDIDRVLTTLDRRYPDICLKNASRPVTEEEYTRPGGVLDIAKVYELFQQGSTITLAYLDTVLPPLTLFCRVLENEFSHPFQTNIYLTPPSAQGAKPHYDTHDVFVLQIAGSKRWTIFGTPVELPLSGQDFDPQVHEVGAPALEFELHAGDVAYIPRGVAHEARSTDTVSLHITAGILRYTWADLLIELIAVAALNDSAFRKALPPGFARTGFDRTGVQPLAFELLQKASNPSNFNAALGSFIEKFLSACPPVLQGQMGQLAALDRISADTWVGARPGVLTRFEDGGNSELVDCYGRTISFPPHAGAAVRFALSGQKCRVKNLPGKLDETGKLTLVRRLIREGLVVTLPE